MGAVAFNTYELVKNLEKAGMSEEQAEAISTGILRAHEVADLATKADVREVKAEIRESQVQSEVKISKVEASLRESLAQTDAKINKLEAKLDKETSEIRGEIKLLKWMLGVTLAGVSSLIVMAISLVVKTFFGA